MKMNKGNFIRIKVGKLWKWSSHHFYSLTLADSSRKKYTLSSQQTKPTLSLQQKKHFSPQQQPRQCETATTQPMRGWHHPELFIFLQWPFTQSGPSQLPLLLYKGSCLCSLDMPRVCWSLHVPNCNSVLFINKLIFPP